MAISKVRQYGNRSIPTLKDKVEFVDIVNDTTTGGTLKPLSAEQGKELKNSVNQEVSDRVQAIIDLKDGVSASNSTLGKIEINLNQEISDRQTAITQEVSDRNAAITAEAALRSAADVVLQNNINTLAVNGGQAVADEEARAIAEEARIEAKVDGEIAIRTAEIGILNGDTSVIGSVDQKISVETSRAQAAEAANGVAIGNEETARIAADNVLQSNINTLTTTVNTNYSTVTTAISNEAITRAAADTAQSNRLTAIEGTLAAGVSWKGSVADLAALDALDENSIVAGQAYYVTAEKDVYVVLPDTNGDYQPSGFTSKSFLKIADFTELSGLVTAERNRAIAAETTNAADISAEAFTRAADDVTLQNNINAEITARLAAETTLQNNIDAEELARITADNVELARATAAESVLQGEIDLLNDVKTVVGSVAYAVEQEAIRAKAAELVNATAIATETTNRIADVDSEELRATTAEGVIDARVTQEIADRIAANTTESSARTAADTALSDRLDIVEGDKTTVGSIAKAEFDAKVYADMWIPMAKLEGANGTLMVVGDSIGLTYAPMTDGIINGEVLVYKVDLAGVNEVIAVGVANLTGSTITLDVVTSGEFDGCTAKVHYFFREGDQGGASFGIAGEGGAGM